MLLETFYKDRAKNLRAGAKKKKKSNTLKPMEKFPDIEFLYFYAELNLTTLTYFFQMY